MPGLILQKATTCLCNFAPCPVATVFSRAPPAVSRQVTRAVTSSPDFAASASLTSTQLRRLEEVQLDYSFTRELPGDPCRDNRPRQVYDSLYSAVDPTPTGTQPYTILYSQQTARLIGLEPSECSRPEFALYFSGNAPFPGSSGRSYAHCYGGHQFGHWAGQLGDGRAIVLGESLNAAGQRWELQLKGAGRTPYSRFADGRAVLRSSVREFLASEAMAALGVPTTRALSLVGTGAEVMRDMFYNGNAQMEGGAVVCRVSPSFIRFGSFQLPAYREEEQRPLVKTLADYVLRHLYPHLQGSPAPYQALLAEVSERTGRLLALWHTVGFTHGVLNTDNMSILGETIDYGPYGFLERFDPNFTPNTTDLPGRRYCFRNQPSVGQWNLAQLGTALVVGGLMTEEAAQDAVSGYAGALSLHYNAGMAAKLGLREYRQDLVGGLLTLMYEDAADFTNTFRMLSGVTVSAAADVEGLPKVVREVVQPQGSQREAAWKDWLSQYRTALVEEGMAEEERMALQNSVNPLYIPRNHVMQAAIADAEKGDYQQLHQLYRALQQPFQEQEGAPALFREAAPAKCRLGVELLSCSS